MANTRTRVQYEYLAVSGEGKTQSAFGVFQPNADLDVRDKCTVTIEDNVNRRIQRDCDDIDIIDEPILTRDTQITLDYNEGFTPQILARWVAYKEGVAASPTGSTANEVQTFAYVSTVSGGTFTISYTIEGKTGTTEPIAYNANAATIQAAMLKKTGSANAMGRLFKAGDVVVTGSFGASGIVFTFGGRYAAYNVPAPTIANGSITGGGSIGVTQTTAGSQISHGLSRTTDSTLPLFSVITGDKNGSYDHFKYGDCAVNSITPTFSQEAGAIVGLSVVIYCNYVAERESSYSVPSCVNITPLKTEQCSVSIDGNFETPDIASLTAVFDNQIPREAAHAYDDIDITLAYQRGDNPTQNFTLSVYGTPEANVYLVAEAEETQGNEVPFILNMGNPGNRVSFNCSGAKLKFQSQKTGEAGALRQKTINIEATPHVSPPLTYTATISQSNAFLVSS